MKQSIVLQNLPEEIYRDAKDHFDMNKDTVESVLVSMIKYCQDNYEPNWAKVASSLPAKGGMNVTLNFTDEEPFNKARHQANLYQLSIEQYCMAVLKFAYHDKLFSKINQVQQAKKSGLNIIQVEAGAGVKRMPGEIRDSSIQKKIGRGGVLSSKGLKSSESPLVLVIELEIPFGISNEAALDLIKEASLLADQQHREIGGHGLKVTGAKSEKYSENLISA